MDRDVFGENFRQAHNKAILYAREIVIEALSDSRLFFLYPNQSYDGNPLIGDEERYPEESLPEDEHLAPLTESLVIDRLWRNGKVPEWIDVSVESCDKKCTYISLLCCGRYTAKTDCLYHQREGYPPFHATSPYLPPGWESVETNGRFDLHWSKKRQRAYQRRKRL